LKTKLAYEWSLESPAFGVKSPGHGVPTRCPHWKNSSFYHHYPD